jgi:hypothetical protein
VSFTFLPIVQHELRAAARRRSTFLARGVAAAIALIGALFYILTDPAGAVTASSGFAIFRAMSFFAAAICCLIPIVLASDLH